MDISNKVLQIIKERRIGVIPRWRFRAKKIAMWTFIASAILAGGLASSVMLFQLVNNDWDIYQYLNTSFFEYTAISLPYLWIVLVGLLSWFVYYSTHNQVYKLKPLWIIGSTVVISLFLGVGLNRAADLGVKIDKFLVDKVPYYEKITQNKKIWTNPDKGLLSGEITAKEDDKLNVKDFTGKNWQIILDKPDEKDKSFLRLGATIKILGKEEKKSEFKAREVRDWRAIPVKKIAPQAQKQNIKPEKQEDEDKKSSKSFKKAKASD